MFFSCEHLSTCVCASFSFGFEGGMWDLIVLTVLISDHCSSFTFLDKVHVCISCILGFLAASL